MAANRPLQDGIQGAMSEIQAKLLDKLRAKVAREARAEPDGPDPRDARIAQLEEDLEAERNNAADLRKTIDEQRFRNEILEQSYSKQLEDARARAAKAEAALEAANARARELETARDTLAAEREKSQNTPDRMTARERGAVSFDPVAHGRSAPLRPPGASSAAGDDGPSIDDLLAADSAVDPHDRANARVVTNGPSASVELEDTVEDMLSLDEVFSGKDRDDSDDA